jgi:hypothetical protein
MTASDAAIPQQQPLRCSETKKELPPATSRGVTTPSAIHSESHLDWLTVRTEYPDWPDERSEIKLPLPAGIFRAGGEIPGIPHYRQGIDLEPAGKLFWNPADKQRGSLLSLSGDELHTVRQQSKVTDDELLDRVLRRALAVTRLDFCITIDAGDPRDLIEQVRHGNQYTRTQRVTIYQDLAGGMGFTIYFGSPKSKKMARIYDKAAQLKILGQTLTRIELQTRKEVSTEIARQMSGQGVAKVGRSAIRQFIDFPEVEWYQLALSGLTVEVNLTPRKKTDFMAWLETQVGPAIERRYRQGKYADDIDAWFANLGESLVAIKAGGE